MISRTGFFSRAHFVPRGRSPVDATVLVYVRIAVGLAAWSWAKSFLDHNLYDVLFQQPRVLFKYPGFDWVKLWPGDGIYWHFVVTMLAGAGLVIGLLTRLCAAVIATSIAYVLMVEASIYVNHYYLLACLAGLFVFLPSDRFCSVDVHLGWVRRERTFARWQLWLLRFQLGLPYLFGAIAKLNADWFAGQPARIILSRNAELPLLGSYLTLPGMVELMSYGGFLYDLLIIPLLMFRRTRILGVAWSLGFHLTNAQLLNIGFFPWLMLATLPVFFPDNTMPRLWRWLVGLPLAEAANGSLQNKFVAACPGVTTTTTTSRIGISLAWIYVVIQLWLPIRPWIVPGNPSWHERGQRFAWRMMLRDKVTLVHFLVVDVATNEYLYLPSHTVLTANQMQTAERSPELIRQAALELTKMGSELGIAESRIHVLALVSLNGRVPQPMIDPALDITKVQRGWWSDDWVTASPGPLGNENWKVDTEQWWQRIDLPAPFQPLQGRTPEELREFLSSVGTMAK